MAGHSNAGETGRVILSRATVLDTALEGQATAVGLACFVVVGLVVGLFFGLQTEDQPPSVPLVRQFSSAVLLHRSSVASCAVSNPLSFSLRL